MKLDGRKAGVQGESRSKVLRLTFSPEWKDLEKSIVWQDARGETAVRVVLVPTTTEINEYGGLRIDTKIPGEALAYAGECAFTVTGYDLRDNARSLSAETVMQVEENELAGKEAVNAQDPTPDAVEQLQAAVDNAIGVAAADKAAAESAKTAAESAKTGAETARELAESYTNHPPAPGDNGNWQVWDGEKYVDSGFRSNGVYVGAGEMPAGFNVQVDPNGSGLAGFPCAAEVVDSLPMPEARLRGKVILVHTNGEDKAYICVLKGGTYHWIGFLGWSGGEAEGGTAVLGVAILGKMVLGRKEVLGKLDAPVITLVELEKLSAPVIRLESDDIPKLDAPVITLEQDRLDAPVIYIESTDPTERLATPVIYIYTDKLATPVIELKEV